LVVWQEGAPLEVRVQLLRMGALRLPSSRTLWLENGSEGCVCSRGNLAANTFSLAKDV
jgi:hypothetical protein